MTVHVQDQAPTEKQSPISEQQAINQFNNQLDNGIFIHKISWRNEISSINGTQWSCQNYKQSTRVLKQHYVHSRA